MVSLFRGNRADQIGKRQHILPGRSSELLPLVHGPPSLRYGAAVFALRCAPSEGKTASTKSPPRICAPAS